MSFTMDDVLEVLKIVKECEDSELHIDTGDIKLSLVKGEVSGGGRTLVNFDGAQAPAEAPAPAVAAPAEPPAVSAPAAAAAPAAEAETVADENLIPITASVASVFYRAASPDEPAFVEVGDQVEEDSVLCLLEVMKCFRQVTAEVKGRVEKICIENNDLVQEGTVMFLIRPD